MFFDIYRQLCLAHGGTPTGIAAELGIGKSTVSGWKTRGSVPHGEQLKKIAARFGVSVEYLLGEEEQKDLTPKGEVSDEDIKFALFEGAPVTDEQFEEVKRFAKYVRDRDIHST